METLYGNNFQKGILPAKVLIVDVKPNEPLPSSRKILD
jgi:hypothetical protein